jgi:hypothetical protein
MNKILYYNITNMWNTIQGTFEVNEWMTILKNLVMESHSTEIPHRSSFSLNFSNNLYNVFHVRA